MSDPPARSKSPSPALGSSTPPPAPPSRRSRASRTCRTCEAPPGPSRAYARVHGGRVVSSLTTAVASAPSPRRIFVYVGPPDPTLKPDHRTNVVTDGGQRPIDVVREKDVNIEIAIAHKESS